MCELNSVFVLALLCLAGLIWSLPFLMALLWWYDFKQLKEKNT